MAYAAAVKHRNRRYDRGAANVYRADAAVISVGNLTVGGSGKTPLVQWIVRRLDRCGVRTAILSRGYGAADDAQNDEARELQLALPGVPHLQDPDRRRSARQAVERWGTSALVLDDGFQHRRLARDLDVVLLDASEPFGYGRLLPRGLLREPCSNLARAQVVVLSRADMLDAAARAELRSRAAHLAPRALWCEVVHQPRRLIACNGESEPLECVRGRTIAAFCGIGNPAGFRHTLDSLGCRVKELREFPDHHDYTADDCRRLAAWTRAIGATDLLCTRKDLVKLDAQALDAVRLRAVEIGIRFEAGQAEFEMALHRTVGLVEQDSRPLRSSA